MPPINHKGAGARSPALQSTGSTAGSCHAYRSGDESPSLPSAWSPLETRSSPWRPSAFPIRSVFLASSPAAVVVMPICLRIWTISPSRCSNDLFPAASPGPLGPGCGHLVLPAPITGSQKLQHTAKDDFTGAYRLSLALSHLMRFFF